MELVNHRLLAKYKTWVDALSGERALFNNCVIGINDVLDAHFSIVDFFWEYGENREDAGDVGPKEKELLLSALAMQIVADSENRNWKTEYEKCAALFYGLIKNPPFRSFNKRTALLTALYYLARLNRTPTGHHKELEVITLIIASNTIRDRKAFKPYSKFEDGEIRFLAQYFQENTRPIDKRYYVITYNELNKILGNFGFSLNNPHGNSIDINRIEKRPALFGFPKKRGRHIKIGVIGFPGWTREVSKEEIRLLRKHTGLTARDGFGSESAYGENPPLSSLVNQYSDILQQLAKK